MSVYVSSRKMTHKEQVAFELGYKQGRHDAVKHGKWMPDSDDDQDEGCYYCSECKSAEFFPEGIPFSRFCSNCGARMDGDENA